MNIHIRAEDGSYWATVDERPGVFATGDTLAELYANVQEGLLLVLSEWLGDPPVDFEAS